MQQELIFTNHVAEAIDRIVDREQPPQVFAIADANTATMVMSRLQTTSASMRKAQTVTVKAGDMNKNIESLSHIWRKLGDNGCSRHSLIVNVGGGVVTDMGAFAAATFKRGVRFVNIPTTLLGAVDAAVGGKTGINFNGLKNEVGVFAQAISVIISTTFFDTLPHQELLSGYAEMLKHGLLSNAKSYNALLGYIIAESDPDRLLTLLEESVKVKASIVSQDPTEQGIRKALNLGHTAGHAFESYALSKQSPIPHGYAVAWGLVVELVLSHLQQGFSSSELYKYANYVLENYGAYTISCDDYDELLRLMHHDKKNTDATAINFTLLRDIGDPVIDTLVDDEQVRTALDIYRDLMHI